MVSNCATHQIYFRPIVWVCNFTLSNQLNHTSYIMKKFLLQSFSFSRETSIKSNSRTGINKSRERTKGVVSTFFFTVDILLQLFFLWLQKVVIVKRQLNLVSFTWTIIVYPTFKDWNLTCTRVLLGLVLACT